MKLHLSATARERLLKSQHYLQQRIASGEHIYGVNTGFGAFCNQVIPPAQLGGLQHNLLLSHACGVGPEVSEPDIIRLMLWLKIEALCLGHSGVRVELVERLIAFYNQDLLPVVFQQGSLGASGDLVPLAHLSLPLLGVGEVYLSGEKIPASEALDRLGFLPLELAAKEGLALINGTQYMLATGAFLALETERLAYAANSIGALSADAFLCKTEPYHQLIQQVRPHQGQIWAAQQLRELLKHSPLQELPRPDVQDPYSFRCMPQVHGASYGVWSYFCQVIETEINSATDNPLIFPEEEEVLMGGNFHGQVLALALDYLAIALCEWANISERRTYTLLHGKRGLSTFLTPKGGIMSGLMIPQYAAASLVSLNKQLATPASVDSIPSSNGQEDHVSMGANAAIKALKILENSYQVLAIELLTALRALNEREQPSSPKLMALFAPVSDRFLQTSADQYLQPHIQATTNWLKNTNFVADLAS